MLEGERADAKNPKVLAKERERDCDKKAEDIYFEAKGEERDFGKKAEGLLAAAGGRSLRRTQNGCMAPTQHMKRVGPVLSDHPHKPMTRMSHLLKMVWAPTEPTATTKHVGGVH